MLGLFFVHVCWHFQIVDFFGSRSRMYETKGNPGNLPPCRSSGPMLPSQPAFSPLSEPPCVCFMYNVHSFQLYLVGGIENSVSLRLPRCRSPRRSALKLLQPRRPHKNAVVRPCQTTCDPLNACSFILFLSLRHFPDAPVRLWCFLLFIWAFSV